MSTRPGKNQQPVIATNKKAYHDYFIDEVYECGIVLTGTEIKSIRLGNINLKDSYCVIKDYEAYIINMHISEYAKGNLFNHDPKRIRKLLLTHREIIKLNNLIQKDGLTLVPLDLHLVRGLAKLNIGVARGKKNYDKRETLKEKAQQRDLAKE